MTTYRIATEADDAQIRAMLRDNAMPGWVEMAIEREPSFFAGENLFGRDWAVIAEEAGDVVGMYTVAMIPAYLNGRREELGYLGGLRVNPPHRRRIRHLRGGYASITRLAPRKVPCWFTVVGSENRIARRLLESGIAGIPPYHFQGEYRTLALAVARGKHRGLWRRAEEGDADEIVAFHNRQAARFQYAPVLDAALARRLDFYVAEREGELRAVAALWDQRAFKQIVARRYRRPLGTILPFRNLYARALRRIPLPREGRALDQTFIAFLAMSESVREGAYELMQDLLSHCRTPAASIGLHAGHPLLQALERFKPVSYPARIYAVSFDDTPLNGADPAPHPAVGHLLPSARGEGPRGGDSGEVEREGQAASPVRAFGAEAADCRAGNVEKNGGEAAGAPQISQLPAQPEAALL